MDLPKRRTEDWLKIALADGAESWCELHEKCEGVRFASELLPRLVAVEGEAGALAQRWIEVIYELHPCLRRGTPQAENAKGAMLAVSLGATTADQAIPADGPEKLEAPSPEFLARCR